MKALWGWMATALLQVTGNVLAVPTAMDVAGSLNLPLAFEANRGQAESQVLYLARSPGYTAFLTATQAVLSRSFAQEHRAISMRMLGGDADATTQGIEPLATHSNYFTGNDPTRWRKDVPAYAKVRYEQVYPGIDVVYHGNQRQLEYDFVLAPHANPRRIALEFSGAEPLRLDRDGNLVLVHSAGMVQQRPLAWQNIDGVRRTVDVRYVLHAKRRVGFALGPYDAARELVIDPVFVYSSYLGGTGDDGAVKIAVDSAGSAYVVGHTASTNFPVLGAAQPVYGGGGDIFVAKLNAAGTALVYSTYFGGTGGDSGQAIAVDANGKAYLTGSTSSLDFPTTANAAQPAYGGGNDGFLVILDSTGALAYSSYLGGSGLDVGTAVAVDGVGDAYVTGYTQSTNFPVTNGVVQTALAGIEDAFVAQISAAGEIIYSTYVGGSALDLARGIAVDGAGNAYIAGYTQSTDFPVSAGALQKTYGGGNADAFVAALDPTGANLVYATFLGGSADDYATTLALDANGNAYVAGNSNSVDFPVTAAVQASNGGGVDAFVTQLDASGSSQIFSTYLGGSGYDTALGIALDASGAAYVTGYTQSANFPTTANAGQRTFAGGSSDAFVVQLTAVGAFGYGSYLGGSGLDSGYGIAVGNTGVAYMTGNTMSSNFPVTLGALQPNRAGSGDAFVTAFPASTFDEIFRDGFE